MSRFDRLAVILSFLGVAITACLGSRIFQNLPHLEDEIAYTWQAEAIAYGGAIKLVSPPCPTCFLVPFVVDFQGFRFGKYPIAWPVVLAAGIKIGARNLVNPVLAGLGIWLTYRLGKKLLNEKVAALAAFLTLTSPFFLINSSSLLSHPLALDMSLILAVSWMGMFYPPGAGRGDRPLPTVSKQKQLSIGALVKAQAPGWIAPVTGGLALGVLALTRPLTAVGVAVPFAIHGMVLMWRGPNRVRQLVLLTGGIAFSTSLLFFVWQYALTGNALLDPYTLWWPYDRIGFGPGTGLAPNGNDLAYSLTNIYTSLRTGASDLFGWGRFSWIFLPFGIWALRRQKLSWLVGSVFPSLVLVYILYWIGAWILGPRYYYEGLYSLTIFSAVGIAWLAGVPIFENEPALQRRFNFSSLFKPHKPDFKAIARIKRPLVVATLLSVLLVISVFYYDPIRMGGLTGLYGVSRANITAFLNSQPPASTPALVIVHVPPESWIGYGTLLDLETPLLNTPYIFIIDNGSAFNQAAIDAFPDRRVIDYYP